MLVTTIDIVLLKNSTIQSNQAIEYLSLEPLLPHADEFVQQIHCSHMTGSEVAVLSVLDDFCIWHRVQVQP
eukprot:m.98672 g.98672  ORF g.98672 m.98672 type:complete len:71 (-) comp8866_c0_seq1:802-1014(-)